MRGRAGTRDCRCAAPVPEWLQYKAAATPPDPRQEPKWFKALVALGQTAFVLLSLAGVAGAILAVVLAITERGPAQNSNYVPRGVLLNIASTFWIISAVCCIILVRLSRNRQAIADALGLLRKGLD